MNNPGFTCTTFLPHTLSSSSYSIDGWYNNPTFPSAGAIGDSINRFGPATDYSHDGLGIFNITNRLFYGSPQSINKPVFSRKFSALYVFFAQLVLMDIVDVSVPMCPRQRVDMSYDRMNDLLRSERSTAAFTATSSCAASWTWRKNIAQQAKNWATGYMDGSSIYGSSANTMMALRAFKGGKVGTCNGRQCFVAPEGLSKIFDSGANEYPQLLHSVYTNAIRALFLEWHNIIADKIAAEAEAANQTLADKTLFNEARRWTIATYQSVFINELFPLLVSNSANEDVETTRISIYDSFAASAVGYMLFHVPPMVFRLHSGGKCLPINSSTSRLCEISHISAGLADRILDLVTSPAKEMDYTLADDLASCFRASSDETIDLMAVALGRSRDLSLPRFASMYKFLNPELNSTLTWQLLRSECSGDKACNSYVDRLQDAYGNIDDVELLPGGIVHFEKTLGKIMKKQFDTVRSGDIHWYSSRKCDQFSSTQIECIEKTSMYDILFAVLGNVSDIQQNPFLLQDNTCWSSTVSATSFMGYLNQSLQIECHPLSAPAPNVVAPVACSLAGVVIFILAIVFCLYWPHVHNFARPKVRSIKINNVRTISAGSGFFFAKEYLGSHGLTRKWRPVNVNVSQRDRVIFLLDPLKPKTVLRKVLFFNTTDDSRPTVSRAAKRASSIIKHSEALRETVGKHRPSRKLLSTKYYVLVEASRFVSLRIPADAHLVLKFDSEDSQNAFTDRLIPFLEHLELPVHRLKSNKQTLLQNCITKEQHKKRIEALLRAALLEASDSRQTVKGGLLTSAAPSGEIGAVPFEEILHMCEITLPEFAELLRSGVNDKFTLNLFNFIDKERCGAVAYRELVDFLAQLAKGDERERLHLLFQLYDINCDGYLSFEEFATMIASLSAASNQQISDQVLQNLFEEIAQEKTIIIEKSGEEDGEAPLALMSFEDLWNVFQQHQSKLNLGEVTLPGILPEAWAGSQPNKAKAARTSSFEPTQHVEESVITPARVEPIMEEELRDRSPSVVQSENEGNVFSNFPTFARSIVDSYSLQLFWGTLYMCICLGLFALRFADSYLNQKAVVEVVGIGVAVARASALVINFTFATLVLTMARNVFTALRTSQLRYYFPFDSLVEAHKFIAIINLVASVVHTFAHIANFYYLGQLSVPDLWCLMPELKGYRPPPGHNTFLWLGFETLTGLTGFLLVVVYVPIFAFAFGRSFAFRQFWITHQLWYIAAILLFLHGLGCLLQTPLFYAFFLVPAFLLLVDRIVSTLRKHEDLAVVSFSTLPSGVTRLVFEKPQGMNYIAGQWVRINVPECGNEYHPFTLTSAPHEPHMSLHILTVGPWTRKLHKVVSSSVVPSPLSNVRIEGPFGEGHQDWHRSDIAVLVGAGIGVTPFASILKHISHMLSFSYMPYSCKKVYFFWITRNQKQFEWFTDIIRQLEAVDINDFTSTHICITQFPNKFDFRTIMLYICERHFQKLHGRSIFTGLKSTTHFGRPNFLMTLKILKEVHPNARSIGVYTCGPSALIPTVEHAVRENNKEEGPLITHYYETF